MSYACRLQLIFYNVELPILKLIFLLAKLIYSPVFSFRYVLTKEIPNMQVLTNTWRLKLGE